jgi:hypothetical protein
MCKRGRKSTRVWLGSHLIPPLAEWDGWPLMHSLNFAVDLGQLSPPYLDVAEERVQGTSERRQASYISCSR